MSAQARKRVEAHEAERKAERAEAFKAPQATKATKAPAAGSRTRKAGGARTVRKGAKEGHSETAAEVVAKVNAGERTRASPSPEGRRLTHPPSRRLSTCRLSRRD